jgi:signal transduction histidine kinase/DNA-binding response OmpR family regulator
MDVDKQTLRTNTSHERILVVDDNPSTAATLSRAIAHIKPGLEVISATDGRMALEQLHGVPVDLVITDMMMPGMNGLELIEKLRSNPSDHPTYTILITAYDVLGLKETARRLNVNEMLIKPIPPERICQIVSKALEEMRPAALSKELPEVIKHPFKLLVADDNPSNVALLQRYLQHDEYNLITACNGVETLEKTRAEMPDLILLDVNMPEKDGFQVLQEIRSDPGIEHIPVIILTAARISPEDMQFALNLGADDYMTKPFDRRELLARIRTKLRVKEADDAIRRRNKELSLLPEIGRDLSARLDIDELIDVVLHRTVETLGAMLGHMLILNSTAPIHKEYRISMVSADVKLPDLSRLLEKIKETRQGLIINDTSDNSLWEALPDDPTRSIVIVPMFGRLELIGVLVLAHEKAGYFNLEQQLLLQAITSQAAIALENAQLYASMVQEQQRLAAVLESAADSILMFDARGCLLLLNPAGVKLFSDYDAKLGLPLSRGYGYDTVIDLLEETCALGKAQTGEISWPDERVFSAQFTPIEAGGCVAILHDVSHFKNLERVKDQFISTASHDLKNPISVIMGFSQLLSKAGPLNEKQTDFANHIYGASEHMHQLVQDLLDLAKIDMEAELKTEKVDLNSLVSVIADEFRFQAGANSQVLQVVEANNRPSVEVDPFQVRQALRNLVSNAIKYTRTGGSIKISVEASSEVVSVHIKDNGYGISANDLPFIFDRFYRVHNDDIDGIEGNGLGLAIVKSIIEKHSGSVNVVSEPGKGSCFSLTLPLLQESSQAATLDRLKPDQVLKQFSGTE